MTTKKRKVGIKLATFDTHEKSQYWNSEKNGLLTSCDVSMGSGTKVWLDCDKCPHSFVITPAEIAKGSWCPYCANMKICAEDCDTCFQKSFASHPKSKHWLQTANGKVTPRMLFRGTAKMFWFHCVVCDHNFQTRIAMITLSNCWCKYCSNSLLCSSESCVTCFEKSFASHKQAHLWDQHANSGVTPRCVFKVSAKKYFFKCDKCPHTQLLSISTVAEDRTGCSFCAQSKLCLARDCKFCWKLSFAAYPQAKFWDYAKNTKSPREVRYGNAAKFWFICGDCNHTFDMSPNHITTHDHWCPFCRRGKLCGALDCDICVKKSFATHPLAKMWDYEQNGDKRPENTTLHTEIKYLFKCPECAHSFEASPQSLSKTTRCWFCESGLKHCGKGDCKTCKKRCIICLIRPAKYFTAKSRHHSCWTCLEDAIARDPYETPISLRKKISLEIYCLAELQRLARDTDHWLLQECTAWDCSCIPTVSFKPDHIWAFDKHGNCFERAGGCKLDFAEGIFYVLILEVIEISRKMHSNARRPPDDVREQEIRNVFNGQGINVGFVYITMAHNCHHGARKADMFFQKTEDGLEYEVIPDQKDAWKSRIQDVLTGLLQLYADRANTTLTFGS